ncbi:MAG: class I tRNA ligase family protein, partial [Acidobacteria bacterium]|nr:class I tRNA ligase family protein [Acidobacteriota bacterium]
IHRWMLHRVSELAAEIEDALERYRFDVAADRLYHVFWHEYADWYIELIKPELQAGGAERDRAMTVLLEVHDRLLRMLHPFIPFVTEEVWQALPLRAGADEAGAGSGRTITLSEFPARVPGWQDDEAVATMALLQDVVTAVRTVRSEWGVSPARKIDVLAHGVDAATEGTLRRHLGHVMRLAGLSTFGLADEAPRPDPDTVRRIVRGFELHVPLAGIVDRTKEAERVARELARLTRQRGGLQARLANPAFVERADPDVVRDTRDQEVEVGRRQEKLERILAELAP